MSSSASSSTSSPVTPPSSPLPVSVGPGRQRYAFTPSPSASPPFSPAATTPSLSSPLLERAAQSEPALHYSAFSTDAAAFAREQQRRTRPYRPPRRWLDLGAWCFEWVLTLVCCCCRRRSWPASKLQN